MRSTGPRFDADQRPRGRGLRGASAARHAVAADGSRRIDLPARFLQRQRHRSVRVCGLRRVPGSVRRRLVQRQRHLRRRCVRSRAERPRSREHASQSRSVRGHLRARRDWSPTSRWSRNFRRATTLPPRGSIDGRAAIGSCCPGSSAWVPIEAKAALDRAAAAPTGDSVDRALEDDRQPAPHPVGAGRLSCIAGWMDSRTDFGRDLDGVRSRDDRAFPRCCRC